MRSADSHHPRWNRDSEIKKTGRAGKKKGKERQVGINIVKVCMCVGWGEDVKGKVKENKKIRAERAK